MCVEPTFDVVSGLLELLIFGQIQGFFSGGSTNVDVFQQKKKIELKQYVTKQAKKRIVRHIFENYFSKLEMDVKIYTFKW